MPIDFIPDVGFRLSQAGRSMILQTIAFTKPGVALTFKHLFREGAADGEYLDAVSGRPRARVGVVQFATSQNSLTDDVAYKFTDDVGIEHWERGSILLRPVSEYVTIENPGSRDIMEGVGHLYLQGSSRGASVVSLSGFNSVVICTSSDARRSERAYRHNAFGKRLLRINGVAEFAAKIARKLEAIQHSVRDVVYSDVKIVKAESPHVDSWVELNGTGDLKEEFLHNLAECYLDYLIEATSAASVFSKPNRHRLERERRFHFLMPQDVNEPIVVEGREFFDHVEIIV